MGMEDDERDRLFKQCEISAEMMEEIATVSNRLPFMNIEA